jgi:hypothetical protein
MYTEAITQATNPNGSHIIKIGKKYIAQYPKTRNVIMLSITDWRRPGKRVNGTATMSHMTRAMLKTMTTQDIIPIAHKMLTIENGIMLRPA